MPRHLPDLSGPIRIFCPFMLTAVAAVLLLTCPSSATDFVPYADSSGSLSAFGIPHINDNGVIAFRASLDSGGTAAIAATPASGTFITGSADGYSVGTIKITNSGSVVFRAGRGTAHGIYADNGGSITTIIEAPNLNFGAYGLLNVNGVGSILFSLVDPVNNGTILVHSGGVNQYLVSANATFQEVLTASDINNDGSVLFPAMQWITAVQLCSEPFKSRSRARYDEYRIRGDQ